MGGALWHHQDDTSNAPRHNDGDDRARSCARVVAFVGLDAVRGVTRYLCVASRREAVADDGLGIGVIVTSGIGEGENLQGCGGVGGSGCGGALPQWSLELVEDCTPFSTSKSKGWLGVPSSTTPAYLPPGGVPDKATILSMTMSLVVGESTAAVVRHLVGVIISLRQGSEDARHDPTFSVGGWIGAARMVSAGSGSRCGAGRLCTHWPFPRGSRRTRRPPHSRSREWSARPPARSR